MTAQLDPFSLPREEIGGSGSPTPSLAELHTRWAALTDEIDEIEGDVDEVMTTREGCTWPWMTLDEIRLFPAQLAAELKGIERSAPSCEAEWRHAELRRRLADIEANPAKYVALQAAAEAAHDARQAAFRGKAARHGLRAMIDRQQAAREELEQVYDAIWQTPATSIEDIAALLDVAIEEGPHRPSDHPEEMWDEWPWLCLMMQKLRALAPAVEMTWLRRHSPPGRDLAAEVLGAEHG